MSDWPIDPIYDAIRERYPWVDDVGIYNRRKIAGTNVWSQHSWGNAVDIIDPDDRTSSERMTEVVTWLRGVRARGETLNGAKVGTILWLVRDHYDHAHVERDPKFRGTPPLTPAPPEDDLMKPEDVQKALIDAGYDLGTFTPVAGTAPDGEPYPPGADGDWGGASQRGLAQAFTDARNGQAPDLSGFSRVGHQHGIKASKTQGDVR